MIKLFFNYIHFQLMDELHGREFALPASNILSGSMLPSPGIVCTNPSIRAGPSSLVGTTHIGWISCCRCQSCEKEEAFHFGIFHGHGTFYPVWLASLIAGALPAAIAIFHAGSEDIPPIVICFLHVLLYIKELI
jgi:hypothetical protein